LWGNYVGKGRGKGENRKWEMEGEVTARAEAAQRARARGEGGFPNTREWCLPNAGKGASLALGGRFP